MLETLFDRVAGPRECNFIEQRLLHSCFPLKFYEIFKEHLFSQNTSGNSFRAAFKLTFDYIYAQSSQEVFASINKIFISSGG